MDVTKKDRKTLFRHSFVDETNPLCYISINISFVK